MLSATKYELSSWEPGSTFISFLRSRIPQYYRLQVEGKSKISIGYW